MVSKQTLLVPLVTLIVALIVLILSEFPSLQTLGFRSFDWLTVRTAPREAKLRNPRIVIVGIDDASMIELNERWPWPRRIHAQLIEALHEAGAAVIAFDVTFDHPTTESDDAALERAIAKAGNVVLAAELFRQYTPHGTILNRHVPEARLIQAGAKIGFYNIDAESDLVVRRFPEHGESFWKVVLRAAAPALEFDPGLNNLIRYVGRVHPFTYVPYYQALKAKKYIPKVEFANALVLVGRATRAADELTAPQVGELATPFTAATGRFTPGVEIIATLIDNSVNRSSIREVPWWGRGIVLLAVSCWCAFVPWRFRPAWSALSAVAACGVVVAASAALFVHNSLWLPMFSTVAVAVIIYVTQVIFAYKRAAQQPKSVPVPTPPTSGDDIPIGDRRDGSDDQAGGGKTEVSSTDMAHDVFISYASQDKAVADRICTSLEHTAVRCWMAPRNIPPGALWSEVIVDAIGGSRVMVVVFTASANASPDVIKEVELAQSRRVKIVPFRIGMFTPSGSMEYHLSGLQSVDAMTPPLERKIQDLTDAVAWWLRASAAGVPTE